MKDMTTLKFKVKKGSVPYELLHKKLTEIIPNVPYDDKIMMAQFSISFDTKKNEFIITHPDDVDAKDVRGVLEDVFSTT